MFSSVGTFHYGPKIRAIILVDQGIADFYYSLIPKSFRANRQFYPAHVSAVRYEDPPKMEFWGKHENEMIEFFYSPIIFNDSTYFWIDIQSPMIETIRMELGLGAYRQGRNEYHMTIGNIKQ